MMRAKLTPNMISFFTVRRGNWILKISVYKNKQIMVIASHCYDMKFHMNVFNDQELAADFIDQLVIEDNE